MRTKHLAIMACAAGVLAASQGVAQERLQGAELRRVAAPNATHLAYEYQTGAGMARISIDPTSLVSDIERARKRVVTKKAPVSDIKASAKPVREEARRPEIAQAEVAAPAPEVAAAVPPSERKVRVIPLYNTPKQD